MANIQCRWSGFISLLQFQSIHPPLCLLNFGFASISDLEATFISLIGDQVTLPYLVPSLTLCFLGGDLNELSVGRFEVMFLGKTFYVDDGLNNGVDFCVMDLASYDSRYFFVLDRADDGVYYRWS
jgi:hypothetical protein